MGRKKKSGDKPTLDTYKLSKIEKTFLYKKFKEAKSTKDVRTEYLKQFPYSCIPSEKLIHKMYVLFQKDTFRRKALSHSTNVNNNTLYLNNVNSKHKEVTNKTPTSKNVNSGARASCASENIFKKKKRKRRNNRRKLLEVNNKVIQGANSSVEHSLPNSNLKPTTSSSTKLDQNIQNFADNLIEGNKQKAKCSDPEQNKCAQNAGVKNVDIITINDSINVENEKVTHSSQFNFPESSTPNKSLKFNNSNKLSVSPISTDIFVKPLSGTRFETILEISDDEEDKNFITVDKTGFVSKKYAEMRTTEVCSDETQLSSTLNIDSRTKNLPGRPNSAPNFSTTIDLTLTPECADAKVCDKENSCSKQKVEVCYDLAVDDSDISLNSLNRKRNDLLDALAQTIVGDCYKPFVPNKVRNVGSNIYNPQGNEVREGLRMVVIDGSNVAMSHGMKKRFSVEGLKICIDYFLNRGHVVKAFVPRFRCKMNKCTNPRLLMSLEEAGHVVFTPSREIQGKNITCYDDRFIIQCAAEYEGVIVSGDNFRDLLHENLSWRKTIEERVLNFTWVGNLLMFPQDPLGRGGPNLKSFLSH